MFSFLLIVAVFSHTDAACNEGDQILKVMTLDGSPACRHCRCWETVEWVCVVEKSACIYSNDDKQLELVKNQQTDPKQNHMKTYYKTAFDTSTKLDNFLKETYRKGKKISTSPCPLSLEFKFCMEKCWLQLSYTDKGCQPREQIVKKVTLHGSEACLLCDCQRTEKWDCAVERGTCNLADIKSDLCARVKLSSQKILLHNTEECFLCTCRRQSFICSHVYETLRNTINKKACEFTASTDNTGTSSFTTTAATKTTTAAATTTTAAITTMTTTTILTNSTTTTSTATTLVTTTESYYVKMYHVETNFKANWSMSNRYCYERGMRLASISSKEEDERLYEIIKKLRKFNFYWTSGTNMGHKGKFIWMSTGKPVTYTNWFPNEPDNLQRSNGETQHCLSVEIIGSRMGWCTDFCDDISYFVCEL